MTTRQWKAAVAATGLAVASPGIGHLPANATADWAVDKFKVCFDHDHCGDEYTEGTIT